jgi:hypothetical protein
MAHEIHAIKRDEGFLFRLWSTETDTYISDEMTESETREHLLKEAVCNAISEFNQGINGRIERATTKGTSSRIGGPRDLKGWTPTKGRLRK